jgi:hypothetical protein
MAHKMVLGGPGTDLPQACWINVHKYYDNFSKPPEFIASNPRLGSYTLNHDSWTTLAVLSPGKQLDIYTLTNLFDVGKQKVVHRLYSFEDAGVIESVARILKISIEGDHINIIALDGQNNLIEVEFAMVDGQ